MENTPERPLAEIVESLSEKATTVRDAATGLTERIELYEQYLAKLNGRTEGFASGNHPDSNDQHEIILNLRFHRVEKVWRISWDSEIDGEIDHESDWRLLKDAPIAIKIAAVELFPDLLLDMEKAQKRTIKLISKATASFDAFFETLKSKGGK